MTRCRSLVPHNIRRHVKTDKTDDSSQMIPQHSHDICLLKYVAVCLIGYSFMSDVNENEAARFGFNGWQKEEPKMTHVVNSNFFLLPDHS